MNFSVIDFIVKVKVHQGSPQGVDAKSTPS